MEKNAVGAEEVYDNPEIVRKNAVIIGGGLVGLELGIFLATKGHHIIVVEMLNSTIATTTSIGRHFRSHEQSHGSQPRTPSFPRCCFAGGVKQTLQHGGLCVD